MLKSKKYFLLIILSILIINKFSISQNYFLITDSINVNIIGKNTFVLKDDHNQLSFLQVAQSKQFVANNTEIPNFYSKFNTYWLRFSAINSLSQNVLLNVDYPLLNSVVLYKVNKEEILDSVIQGFDFPINEKKYNNQSHIFDLNLAKGDTGYYFLKITSKVPIVLPLKIGTSTAINKDLNTKDILSGIYFGIIIALFLYNIFLFLSIKDKSYLYYIVYILFIGLTQLTLMGYTWRFLWPNSPYLNQYAVILFPCIAGISAIGFSKLFLELKPNYPKIIIGFNIFAYLYAVSSFLVLIGFYSYSYYIIYALITSSIIARNGNRSAWFFLGSWSILIVCVFLFVLRNFGVLPANNYTNYILFIGSASQAVLLSIALADRINVYKKEKEKSQAEALYQSQKNEELVKEQNVQLEKKVLQRTEALQLANANLSTALQELKDAQIQLVESEKMASLGQLTAGIAHEINNPINFVKSNIKPLQIDVKDIFDIIEAYHLLHSQTITDIPPQLTKIKQLEKQLDIDYLKQEITNLMEGIEEGAERTAEIVRGLRTFSRLDESEVKTVDIHDGIESTLIILRNATSTNIKIIKQFEAEGIIECFPGKLNQVFMNIISNALHAIKCKGVTDRNEEFITISTRDISNNKIEIKIKDSGNGMTPEIKSKIFDPFFTTKDVGEGTGLGLAIVFKIIQKHGGTIFVNSSPGNGAEFVITLYHSLPKEATTT
jgi:two-component system, NtrC family, sensor kinase